MPILTNVTKLANKIKVRSSNVCWSSDSNLQHTTKHISKKYPQFLLSSPVLWSVVAKWLFLSVPLYYIVRNTIFCLKQSQGLKTSVAHSLYPNSPLVHPQYKKQNYITPGGCSEGVKTRDRASDILRGHGPVKFRYFCEIPWNSPRNAKYREIHQKYFQIHGGKTYLILILVIRPVLFTPNVQIYLETSSLQWVNNVPKLPGVFRWTLRKTGH